MTFRTQPAEADARSNAFLGARDIGFLVPIAWLASFVMCWTLYFALANAPTPINHDLTEAYAWGRQFELGYYQHPPFWAWICGVWFRFFPRTLWAFSLLSSLNAALGLWGAGMLIGDFAQGAKRSAAWMLLLLTPCYTFLSYKYNANLIFLSIWPWAMHFFVRSIDRRSMTDAFLFGVVAGLGLLSKYYVLVLLATCFLAALQHPRRWNYFTSPSPYLSAATAAALCTPHIWWLLVNRAPPIHYLASISGQNWTATASYAAETLLGALAMNLPAFLIVAVIARSPFREWSGRIVQISQGPPSRLRMLATLTIAPLALTLISGILLRTKITAEMTVGTFGLAPLLMIEIVGPKNIDRLSCVASRLAATVSLGALALSPAIALATTYLAHTSQDVRPSEELAIEATKIWRARTGLPLVYVAGSDRYANDVAFYSPERPHAFELFQYSRNLWVTPEALAQDGLLSVCIKTDDDCLATTAKFSTPQSTQAAVALSHVFWGHSSKTSEFVVTVIPPRSDSPPTGDYAQTP
jgi:hypothetical protein